jgi:hypothetical protein
MKITAHGAILSLSIFAWQPLHAALPAHSVSPSREFVIYGGDAALRGTISKLAEQTKSNLLALLRQRDEWKTTVILNLQQQQANLPEIPPANFRVTQTGFGAKLQLDLIVSQDLDASLIERQLLRAVLFEMIYRDEGDLAAGARNFSASASTFSIPQDVLFTVPIQSRSCNCSSMRVVATRAWRVISPIFRMRRTIRLPI